MNKKYSTTKYNSPFGEILIAADNIGLVGLWFYGQKYFPQNIFDNKKENSILQETKIWLDIYFSGKNPDFTPKINFEGTPFQIEVWKILQKISYGTTITYGEIAKEIAEKRGLTKMSAQAIGGAVGHNKISIIVPCHRVIGSNNSLTGYAGGIDKKLKLLNFEGVNINNFIIPKK